VKLIRQIAVLPAKLNRAAFDLLAVVAVGLLVITLDDFQFPASLWLWFCRDKPFRQFHLNLGGGKSTLTAMRHLKRCNDGAFFRGGVVDESGMRKALRCSNRSKHCG